MGDFVFHKLEHYIQVTALVLAFETVRKPDFVFSGEQHDFWEMVYVAEGKIGVTADDKIFILNAGDLMFYKPMVYHRLWSEGGESARIIIISFKATGKGLKLLEDKIFKIDFQDEKLLRKILAHKKIVLGKEAEVGKESNRQDVKAQSRQFIKIYLELFLLSALNNKHIPNTQHDSSTSRNYNIIINKMKENLYQPLQVKDIAKLCNLSVSNLKKIFKIYSGKGVARYFKSMKINEAMNLLKEDLTIREISDLLSFSSQNSFAIAFKQETGLPPSKYRETLRREAKE